MTVTFKKHPKTGLYRSFQNDFTDIKLGRKVTIGNIVEERGNGQYRVGLMVKEGEGKFKWVHFKLRHPTEQEARDWFVRNFETLSNKYEIYQAQE